MKKSKTFVLFLSLFLTHNIYANEKGLYTCTVDNFYTMGDGMSSDEDVGELLVTIDDDDVEIQSDVEGIDSSNLKLVVNTDIEIVAINESMQYSYSVSSNKFSLTTGIGQSDFKKGVGHIGEQMLVYGKCTKN
jgi:hypothetical protein